MHLYGIVLQDPVPGGLLQRSPVEDNVQRQVYNGMRMGLSSATVRVTPMAILIDEHARAEVARHRARGRQASLQVTSCPLRGMGQMLQVGWAGRHPRKPGLVARQVGDVVVYLPPRLARYAQWQDVTISAWHLGPFARLGIVDEPLVVLAMGDWEQTHPQP